MESSSSSEVASQSVELKIQALFVCLDQMQKALSKLCVRKNIFKKPRREIDQESKVEQFKKTMKFLRLNFLELMKGIAIELAYLSVYDQIAKDIMKTLVKLYNKFEVDYSHYRLVIESVMTSIIANIMDDWELSKAATERQERRKYFAQCLINAKSNDINPDATDATSPRSEEDIFVDTNGPPSQAFHRFCTREGILFLNLLIEALTRHSKVITQSKSDLSQHVYHIVNITHIVDILKDHMCNVKFDLLADPEWHNSANITLLKTMVNDFQTSIAKNLDLFECDHPLLIFRNDLRCLLLQVRTLQRILNK